MDAVADLIRTEAPQTNIDNIPMGIVRWQVAGVESGCEHSQNHPDQWNSRLTQRIEPAINYMFQHVNKPARISTLSAIAGISKSHFLSLSKSLPGYTPLDFFIRLRIQRACELLRGQNLSIKETAAILGYNDQFYFSRIFKKVTGVAPSNYKKRIVGPSQEQSDSAQTGS